MTRCAAPRRSSVCTCAAAGMAAARYFKNARRVLIFRYQTNYHNPLRKLALLTYEDSRSNVFVYAAPPH